MVRYSAATLLSMCLTFAATNAFALECTVADPSGTPMNVRSRPNGAIVGALHNDTTVFVSGTSSDGRWAKVSPAGEGKTGWVAKRLLDCP